MGQALRKLAARSSTNLIQRLYIGKTPTQGGTGSLISPCSLEKMVNPPWSMVRDSLCNVGSWLTMRISIISSLDCFLTL